MRITRILLTLALLSITHPGCRVSGDAVSSPTSEGLKSRTFHFEYVTRVKDFPAGAKLARVWIPLPQSDETQSITDLRVDGVVDFEVTTESEYGNKMIYADFAAPLPGSAELKVSFTVLRREVRQVSKLRGAPQRARLLAGDRYAALGPEVSRRGAEACGAGVTVEQRAHGIYDRVLADVDYDKSGTGWGRGDIEYVCDVGKGNCSDFHTLYIGMARTQKIPAVFEIGFPIPASRQQGTIGGYHCWAWYEDRAVWRPVDVSEADKVPERAEYFFGTICENRLALTIGRDLVLSPPQSGVPINFFVYPYVEVDGRTSGFSVESVFRFSDAG